MAASTLPLSTYRLQFNAEFTFTDAAAIVDYLHALGVSHCYASSYLTAVPGSTHGYDVADPTRLNPELGDEAEYAAWIARAARPRHGPHPRHRPEPHGHCPVGQSLVAGRPRERRELAARAVFDIDWQPLKQELEDKVLLPVLGDPYGAVLERQEIQLEYDTARSASAITNSASHRAWHLRPDAAHRQGALLQDIGEESDDGVEFLSILTAIRHLPGRSPTHPSSWPNAIAKRKSSSGGWLR